MENMKGYTKGYEMLENQEILRIVKMAPYGSILFFG